MAELWQSSEYFTDDSKGIYKFVGEHGTSFLDDIFVRLAVEGREWNEITFIIKAREMNIYQFHSNPSELLGFDTNIKAKINSDEINYIHDMEDYEITTMLEEMLFLPLVPPFEKQFGYRFDMAPMDWEVDKIDSGRLFVTGTF